jgi:ketosteroid isomerase-like protein
MGMAAWLYGPCLPALAKHRIAKGAEVEAPSSTVREIHENFHKAEHALETGDLDALMAVYSDNYENLGLTKDDMEKMWGDLFARYRRFLSNHSMARVDVTPGEPPVAEVTCSGSLWATSKETGKRTSVDSWLWETHILVREDGEWRIRGPGKNAVMTQGFGATVHPLF